MGHQSHRRNNFSLSCCSIRYLWEITSSELNPAKYQRCFCLAECLGFFMTVLKGLPSICLYSFQWMLLINVHSCDFQMCMCQNHLEGFSKLLSNWIYSNISESAWISDLVGLVVGWSLRTCICNISSSDANAAGPGIIL